MRRDLPLHGDRDRESVRLQVDLEAQVVEQERSGRRPAGGADLATPDGAGKYSGVQGGIRGPALGKSGDGTVRRRGALRPDNCQGPLLGACRRHHLPGHRQRRPHLPLHGGDASRSQAREFLALLATKDEGAMLKAVDFGRSAFIEDGEVYRDIVGSAYFVAPEVLWQSYGKEADVWSAGVILYVLLSGVPPFWAETVKGIFDAILQGDIDFESDPWPSISDSAKDLVRKMLTQDPKRRITSAQVLEHPWIKGGQASDKPRDNDVLARMKLKTNKAKVDNEELL